MQEHIQGYTLAILDIAKEEKKLKEYNEHAHIMLSVFSDNPEYLHILKSHSLDTKTKKELIAKAFSSVNENLQVFLKLLIDKSRSSLILPVLKKLRKNINQILKIQEGTIFSVEKISPSEIKNIEETTSKKLGYNVTLVNLIDKNLIAGVKVVVGDIIIQNDASNKLSEIRNMLLKKEKGSY